MTSGRAPALVVLAAALVALVAVGSTGHGEEVPAFGRARAAALPEADPASALTSTWYCAAGTASDDGLAALTVVVSNLGSLARQGSVTWIPTGGEGRVSVPIEVAPNATVAMAAAEHVSAPVVSALVEVDGGEVAVEHAVSGRRGSSVAPCASQASSTWYLANGSTERDAQQVLALFNPFPDDAVVDITFSTDEGRQDPDRLQGLPIPAGTTSFIQVHEFVRRRAVTATSVVARTGRLVVDRLQSFDGSGRSGISLALAAPAPADTWVFPEGLHQEGITQRWHIYNPGDREAQVSLEIVPAEGAPPEPLDLTIPARTHQTVEAAASERIDAGVAHSSTVRSLNGVPVVAERSVDARRPSARRGWSSALGAPDSARRWAFPVGEANANTDEWIVVHNPGIAATRVSIYALANGQRIPIEDLQDLEVGPAGRLALRLGDHISRTLLPVLVEAEGAVVAERDAYAVGRIGLSTTIGIPLR